MRVINRYLIKEVLYTLLAVTPVILLIFLSSRFVRYLADAATGELPRDLVLMLLGLKLTSVLELLLPLTFFLAILLALGRLYKDSEMVVLYACGVSPTQVLKTVVWSALGLAGVVAGLSLFVSPWADGLSNQIMHRAETVSEINAIEPGHFKESGEGDRIFFIERLGPDRQNMHNIFIQGRRDGRLDIVSAPSGYVYTEEGSEDQIVVLEDGNRYQWTPGEIDFQIGEYEKYTLRIAQTEAAPAQDEEVKPTSELLGSSEIRDIAELQWRISMPITVLLLAMLATLLARTTPRQGRYSKLFVAIAAYVIYHNLMSVAHAWIKYGQVSPGVGMWWVHGLPLLAIIALYVRQAGVRWRFTRNRVADASPQQT